MRRVVVTGLGMVSPLACGVEETWKRLISGENAANTITRFNADNFSTNYACEIPFGDGSNGTFNPTDWMEPKERRKVDDFILYGMAAADMAVADSGWSPKEEEDFYRTGVMIGSPSLTIHLASVPSSIVGDNAGIRILIVIISLLKPKCLYKVRLYQVQGLLLQNLQIPEQFF